MRALFFLNSFSGGGAEKVCLNLAKELNTLNIESDFVTVYNKRADYDIPKYIHVFSLGLNDPYLTRLCMFKCIPKVNEFISKKKYALITAHLNSAQYLASLTKAKRNTLYIMHGSQHLVNKSDSWLYKMNLRKFLRKKRVVTVSKGLKDELNNEYGISNKNVITIYNPFDCTILKETSLLKSPHVRPYILVMGRLEEEKNPLSALKLYYKGRFYNNYDLIYLGTGSLLNSLEKKIMDYNLYGHVFLMGFQRNSEQWIKNASLLLSCSKREGLPMNIVEALVCGTPVVASDCPYGPNEILTGELKKYLIEPEQMDESISAISSALTSYPKINEEYYSKFNQKLITQTYIKMWRKCFGMEAIIL